MGETDDGDPVGAAWARLLPEAEAGYGYLADDVPELAMAVPSGAVTSALMQPIRSRVRLIEDTDSKTRERS